MRQIIRCKTDKTASILLWKVAGELIRLNVIIILSVNQRESSLKAVCSLSWFRIPNWTYCSVVPARMTGGAITINKRFIPCYCVALSDGNLGIDCGFIRNLNDPVDQ